MNRERELNLASFVAENSKQLDTQTFQPSALMPLTGDASFRRYFRFNLGTKTYIAVDSPPDKEENAAFVGVARGLAKVGTMVPEILSYDEKQGFFILSDFGNTLLADVLDESNVDNLYKQAFTELLPIQKCQDFSPWQLPQYSLELLMQECRLFSDWFLSRYCKINLTEQLQQNLADCYHLLLTSADAQPKVCVHRDYHSRNLMLLPEGRLGVIDFQSAVHGPIAYDVVSLLRDCYVAWPLAKVHALADDYLAKAVDAGLYPATNLGSFAKWFDLMGVQRHLKAIGIFARLAKRDHKFKYLEDIPRTINYVLQVGRTYDELAWLVDFIEETALPAFTSVKERESLALAEK